MSALTALLIDDEPLALRRMAIALARIDDVEIVGSTTSAREAVGMIDQLKPDIAFLDIAMPALGGFELIERINPGSMPAIVFVTAWHEHAARAFGVDAVDYLVKPVTGERLEAAVARARTAIEARSGRERMAEMQATIAALREHTEPSPGAMEKSFWAHRNREFVRIPVDTILWVEAEGDYVRLHAGERSGLLRTTLSAMEAELDSPDFIRVHRSVICRRTAIERLRRKPTGALSLSLVNGDQLPVGRSYSKGLKDLLRRMERSVTAPM